ncbi:HD domain-containing phosphohydrolase [Shewanella sp.]|uniref:HD domain-containing phosphohydrolase n=1 Tax=Shewanella sp. TaxID=50422 RepID=UPI003564D070
MMNMMSRDRYTSFLRASELPNIAQFPWFVISDSLKIMAVSEPFYRLSGRAISVLLNQPVSKVFPDFDTNRHLLPERENAESTFAVAGPNDIHYLLKAVKNANGKEGWTLVVHPVTNGILKSISNHAFKSDLLDSEAWLEKVEKVLFAEPDSILNTAVEELRELTQSEIACIHICDEKTGKIMHSEWSDGFKGETIPLCCKSDAFWGDLAKSKTPQIVNKTFSVDNFVVKNHMCIPITYRNHLVGIIGIANRHEDYTEADAHLLLIFATIMWHSFELPKTMSLIFRQSKLIKQQKEKITHSLIQLVSSVADALELKDAYTGGHQKSVAQLSCLIGEKLGLPSERLEGLKLGALIHDLGKLAIPSDILNKPSRLSPEEYALVKMHPIQGAQIISDVEFPWPIKDMVLQHHERLDGSGYPYGLTSNQICDEAKIIAVADVADSMLSHRPYRASRGMQALAAELNRGKGKQYATDVVDACLEILDSQELDNVHYVGNMPLEPLEYIDADISLGELAKILELTKEKVAVVLNDSKTKIMGIITKEILMYWTSPFLDTAAERSADRSLLNKRAHQVMEHKVPSIKKNNTLDDAKQRLIENHENFLIVESEEGLPMGLLTWKVLAKTIEELNKNH